MRQPGPAIPPTTGTMEWRRSRSCRRNELTIACLKTTVGVIVVECRMRTSRCTLSIVPDWTDQTAYLIEHDFGGLGWAHVETDSEYADLETTITALLEGQYGHPVRIVALN